MVYVQCSLGRERSHDHDMTDHMIKKCSPIRVKSIIPHIIAGTYSSVYF